MTAPVPIFKSLMINFAGAGPIWTGTSGAPAGRLPVRATHGFPAAEPVTAEPAVGAEVAVVVVVVALCEPVFFELEPHAAAAAISATATTAERTFVPRRPRTPCPRSSIGLGSVYTSPVVITDRSESSLVVGAVSLLFLDDTAYGSRELPGEATSDPAAGHRWKVCVWFTRRLG